MYGNGPWPFFNGMPDRHNLPYNEGPSWFPYLQQILVKPVNRVQLNIFLEFFPKRMFPLVPLLLQCQGVGK